VIFDQKCTKINREVEFLAGIKNPIITFPINFLEKLYWKISFDDDFAENLVITSRYDEK